MTHQPLTSQYQPQPQWLDWLCECLLNKIPRSKIEQELQAFGFEAEQSKLILDQLFADPIFRWAFEQKRSLKQHKMYLNMRNQLQKLGQIQRLSALSADDFFNRYYATNTPVILEDWVTQWPAYQKWNPLYFQEKYGDVKIMITEGREGNLDYDMHSSKYQSSSTMAEYAQRVIQTESSNDFYLIARNRVIEEQELYGLWDDVIEEPFLNKAQRRGCAALWFGPKGTVTPLHHDTCNIFFAQIWGTKKIDLISPSYLELFDHSLSMYSFENINAEPLKSMKWSIELHAGEALFIPLGWWHQVEATSASISLAMTHFKANNLFDDYRPGALPKI